MQLIAGNSSVTIDNPLYGYATEIKLAFDVTRLIGRYAHADYGPEFDHRTLSASTHWRNESDMVLLAAFLRDNRGTEITLSLGADPTGFFPFGPDLGDKGDFTVHLDEYVSGGVLDMPFRHFAPELRLKLKSAPAYVLPDPVTEGAFSVGGINFRWPQNGVAPTTRNGRTHVYTRSGAQYGLDLGTGADVHEVAFTLEGGAENIGRFLHSVGLPGRTDDVVISVPEHYWLFGPENDSAGAYKTRLITSILSVTHDRFNRFSVPVRYWMREKA